MSNDFEEAIVSNVYFEGAPSSQAVHLRSVFCNGDEDRLDECMFQDGSDCGHDRDVGIICTVLCELV